MSVLLCLIELHDLSGVNSIYLLVQSYKVNHK